MEGESLEDRLIALMRQPRYVPLGQPELAEVLELTKADHKRLKRTMGHLLDQGAVARVKGDRYVLPRDADLVSGTMRFRQSGAATLLPDGETGGNHHASLQVRAEDTGVAFHGDKVLVRLIRRPRGRQRPGEDDQAYARVIRILQRAHDTFPGTLQRSGQFHYVVLDDPRFVQDILVPDPARGELFPKPKVDDKVVVRLLEWQQRHLNPQGEILEVLGRTHTPGAEFKALLHKHKLNPEFPEAVTREVEKIPDKVKPGQRRGRMDCRKLFTFTIDPDDAKDFDDALSIERLKGGSVRVGIHIADVSAYVKRSSQLDKEAQRRGNSTYLVGCVIPMLPHALSNGICSLVEAEDRLTKAVFLTFNANGKLTETQFANTVICSDKRLTYRQAYAFLKEDDLEKVRRTPLPPTHQTGSTGRSLDDLSKAELQQLQAGIRTLWDIASGLRRSRFDKGSLDLDMPEMKIFVDEDGYADRIERIENDESHQLIEEFMLAANEAVAKTLHTQKMAFISRVHDAPEAEKLAELRDYLITAGVQCGDLTQRKEVNRLLKKVKDHPQGYTLKIQFLRSLKQACYRASADGHYGLYKTYYAHFTSPIRRYADLIVHRIFDFHLVKNQLETAPARPPKAYRKGELDHLAAQVSMTEQNSTEAERESVKIKLLEFFERELNRKDKRRFKAIVTDTRNHGMFVELVESQAFGLVHVSTLRDDLYRLSDDGTTLVGRKTGRRFAVGQEVQVEVERVDRFKRQIDFAVTEDPKQRAETDAAIVRQARAERYRRNGERGSKKRGRRRNR
ncbi:MAG: ribonuclease R family protein [Opitutales bacterium]